MLMSIEDMKEMNVSPSCILHIGAHEAEEKEIYKKMGCNKVLWIESMQEKYETISKAIADEPNMSVIIATVWSEDNKVLSFYQTNNGESSSVYELELHKNLYPFISVSKEYKVVTSKIDTLLSFTIKNKYVPDMISLDIQGAELEALMGAKQTLENVKWIYTEISYIPLYKNAATEFELTKFLNSLGYKKEKEIDTGMGWGDALYEKN
jgi:FkbM family methyltransferase